MEVIKRDGSIVPYDLEKISIAISGAFLEQGKEFDDIDLLDEIDETICDYFPNPAHIEDIQDLVEDSLIDFDYQEEAKSYIKYRYRKELLRKSNTTDKTIKELLDGESEYWNKENSNKNAKWVTTQRDYLAGITSKDIARRFIFPKEVIDAHDQGIIHIHDLDYAAQNTLHNCCLINLEDMLQNGTVINGVTIDKPHRFITAATITSQIIAAVASSQYGGTSVSLTHLAPFIRDSYNRYYDKYISWGLETKQASLYAKLDTQKEVADGVQTLNYQLNSLSTTNGQAPFVTLFMYLGETKEYKKELAQLIQEVLIQRIQGMKNKVGVYVTTAFPKLVYVLEEDNIKENSPYWYLTELAAKCTAKRMVPDYVSEKVMLKLKIDKNGEGHCYTPMGCRSFLTPYVDQNNQPKYYGRFNIGVSTINLADAALSAEQELIKKNITFVDQEQWQREKEDRFWKIMDARTELCHEAQKIRSHRLEKTKAEVAPILWCDGALARLKPEDTLYPLIHGGYCTSSLGYAGLYECVKSMTNESHTTPRGKEFGLKVMQYLNDQCNKWKAEENIDYSVYGTPIESTTYKFAQNLQKRFGQVKGITDKDYITNSYHIPVFEEIDAFSKLSKEAEFQKLSPGGAISYVETPNLQDNIPAVEAVMKFIYDNIMYAELNCKSDYCQVCGYDGEIFIKENEKSQHYFECPKCGNTNEDTMNIARRVCGYISTNGFNEGRLEEIAERVIHLDDKEL